MVSTAESIAIAELCVYIPIFILTVVVMIRHGFQRQLGWIYLAIFCIIRLAGAGFKIESVHHPTNKTDTEWSAILQSVGLSPLLMASMGLLKRV
jgi:prolipoprotein diacylglyceryltransferase